MTENIYLLMELSSIEIMNYWILTLIWKEFSFILNNNND